MWSLDPQEAMSEVAILDKFLDFNEVEDFVSKLRQNAPKTAVTLRGNCLGAEGAQILAKFLKTEACELTSLSLEWNQLGSAGCCVLAEALEMNTSLTHLDLRNNSIKNEGAVALNKALSVNGSLRSLDIRWNHISDAAPFKDALLSRHPPLALQINGNHLSESSSVMIDSWMTGEDADDASFGDDENESPSNTAGNSNITGRTVNKHGSNNANAKGNAPHLNMGRSQGMNDAMHTRLQKEAAALRRSCSSMQEEIGSLNTQLESSAVRVTELEQSVLKEQYAKTNMEDIVKNSNARITVQTEERMRLVQNWQVERDDMMEDTRNLLVKRDDELKAVCVERDRAVQDCRIAKEHSAKLEIQLGDQGRMGSQERASMQEEISTLRNQITELTLSESKLKSEASNFETRATRAEQQKARWEEENEQARIANEESFKKTLKEREESEEKQVAESGQRLKTANDKMTQQSKELQDLHTKVSKLEANESTIRADLELQNEKMVAQVREDEAKRTEGTISDLKAKVDMFVQSRAELETRNQEYLKELKEAQDRNKASSHKIVTQLNTAEEEIVRLRELNNTLRDENQTLMLGNSSNDTELTALREKSKMLEEVNSDVKAKLAVAISSQTELENRTRDLQLGQAKHEAQRQVEFFSIKNSLEKMFSREFDALQASLNVAPAPTGIPVPISTAATTKPIPVKASPPKVAPKAAASQVAESEDDYSVEESSSEEESDSGSGEDV